MSTESTTPDKLQLDAVGAVALGLLRKVTGLGEHDLRDSTTFESIHLESLAITAFVSSLEPHFPGLSKTFIFDCRNILDVSAYLIRQHPEDVRKLVAAGHTDSVPAPVRAGVTAMLSEDSDWPEIAIAAAIPDSVQREAIAIIGMQGHFPGAETLEDFWKNLYEGRHAIGEIPADRWSLDRFFEEGTDSRKSGLSYAKWGGFIPDVDKFDAQFFGISAREAAQMDPQERLFLECAWHAMENASLLGERAENLKQGNNYNIGVFVGLTTNTYNLLAADHWRNGGTDVPAAVPWSAANRVSYALNLSGPSLAVDTACSSSLVALHLACESIANGECKAAIAGGVNLYFHPAKYIQLCQLQMLSPTGRCHTFGKDGDGFVPGEGVGAIVLKPLSAAQADGDRILGVIRGTSVNHCGRTNGYTVPNAQSQAQLIRTALDSFELAPSSIGYVEAHGTGTKLGDPIEFTALTETLAGKSSATPCGIGSVKSNIGHLESAAGIAGIIKVLLQLRHRCITPSLGSRELNPALDMAGSRFFVPQAPVAWPPDPETGLRRAGVSSFGAGGTNGHAIIEQAPEAHSRFLADDGMLAFPVSARSNEQLRESLADLLRYIRTDRFAVETNALHALAYTLQCGRRHHPFRFATLAKTRDELAKNIQQYLQNQPLDQNALLPAIFSSHIRPDEETDMQHPTRDPLALARLWSRGVKVVWGGSWSAAPALIDVPLYPFARERHWINSGPETMTMPANGSKAVMAQESRRTFAFTGQEYFLLDHQIDGKPIFPAAGYFDCFYRVLRQYGWGEQVDFQNITWAHPFRPDGVEIVSLACDASQDKSGIALEFSSSDEGKVYCRAHCLPLDPAAPPQDALSDVQARCAKQLDAQACYPIFDTLGMVYGPTFRCMQSAWIGEDADEALVAVSLRAAASGPVLEPGMLDGIFQSSFVFSLADQTSAEHQFIPYHVKSLRVHKRPGAQVLVHVKKRPQNNALWNVFDFTVFEPNGERILEISEFSFRTVAKQGEKTADPIADDHRVHLFQPVWVETSVAAGNPIGAPSKALIFDQTPELHRALCTARPELAHSLWLAMPAEQFMIRPGNIVELNRHAADHLELLWRMFLAEGGLPESMIFHLADGSAHDRLDVPWEAYAGLDKSRDVIEIMRSACQAAPSPRFHVQIDTRHDADEVGAYGGAIAGFLRSVHQEIPTITATVVAGGMQDSRYFAQEFLQGNRAGVQEIQWRDEKRYLRRLRPADVQSGGDADRHMPAANDVIVITGGGGAIARILAESLAETAGVRLALIGRAPEEASMRAFIDDLRHKKVLANYWQADCADREALAEALTSIRTNFGPISSVLHCAGVLKDAFFLRQDPADWDDILKAKVLGALWLDELTQDDSIKWFALCSALAGVRGNIGQSTYGLANAWLNAFAEQRHHDVAKGRRRGATMAIAWSLWNTDGGMQPPQSIIDRYAKKGLVALSPEEGAEIFRQTLRHPSAVVIPIKGRIQAVEQFLDIADLPSAANERLITNVQTDVLPPAAVQTGSPEDAVVAYLAGHLSKVTTTPLAKINPEVSLEAFGLDSILVMELNDLLEKDFPRISKTVLFEARNLRLLAKLLIEEHQQDALRVAEKALPSTATNLPPEEKPLADDVPLVPSVPAIAEAATSAAAGRNDKGDRIAIVGIAGRYPGAADLNELWQHLSAGHDLVSEIPERWAMPDEELGRNPIYAKWGGFIEDFDRFDPLFFGISPRDAERMDPQERLFLQTAWHTLEDAGYTPESLSGARGQAGKRRRVGVIVGVMYGEYQFYGDGAAGAITNSSYASIANRVSYCLDFDGPSFAIDSMCSSSLTSISLACDQLRSGRSDAVIAGGVNLSIHPHKYRMLCELNFASTDGRCRSFGEGGDGYVPGEGVGAVLLKRLEDAERDGDHIYAVIQGSDIGHGAKTSGYTVPNAEAQADVIQRAFERSGIAPSRLSYLEAHGTGTSLGDPIEIRGATKALASQFAENQRCPVGSIKSNIGHLESAAGIAALSKVLLQFQHDKLVPSIHSENLNRNIDFSKTPFYVQRELADWKRDGDFPRVAAISSFGAGGANAHLVVEEHIARVEPSAAGNAQELFLFSARSYPQLIGMARKFAAYLEREMVPSPDGVSRHVTRNRYTPTDVAATLAEGRRHFRLRLAIAAESFTQLHAALQRFIAICGNDDPANKRNALGTLGIFYGDAEAPNDAAQPAMLDKDSAQAWVSGAGPARSATAPWRKVPLPGYEFLRNRYWVEVEQPKAEENKPALKSGPNAVMLTPSAILERVAQGEMGHDEARAYLLAMSKNGSTVPRESFI